MQRHDFENMLVGPDMRVRDALQRLCENGRQVLFVAEEGILKGALTDGDIRRFLLGGGTLEATVTGVANFKPKFVFSTERRNAETVMQDKHVNAMPIVDEDMRIVDVVTAHEAVDLKCATLHHLDDNYGSEVRGQARGTRS